MTQPHQRYRHQKKYKVTNWSSYDRSLVNRGAITLWLSDEVLQSLNDCPEQTFGRPKLYSDLVIETVLSLRLIFKLPLRQTEGLLRSLFKLMSLDLSVPDHTTLSRRNQTLNIKLKRGSDCDDSDRDVYPGSMTEEVPEDGVDQNCNGSDDE